MSLAARRKKQLIRWAIFYAGAIVLSPVLSPWLWVPAMYLATTQLVYHGVVLRRLQGLDRGRS